MGQWCLRAVSGRSQQPWFKIISLTHKESHVFHLFFPLLFGFMESEGSSLGSPGSVWSGAGMHCTLLLLLVWLPLDLGKAQEQGPCPGPASHTIAHPGAIALLAL